MLTHCNVVTVELLWRGGGRGGEGRGGEGRGRREGEERGGEGGITSPCFSNPPSSPTFSSLTDSCSSDSANVLIAGRSSLFEKSARKGSGGGEGGRELG